MDTDTIVNMGHFSEQLLLEPMFQFISGYFEQSAAAELLSTKPHETKLRESIYARVAAHREFLSLLQECVQKKNETEKQQHAPQDHLDIIDDPNVHNIYEGNLD